MCSKGSHIKPLAGLNYTRLSFKWTYVETKEYYSIKLIVTKQLLPFYPNLNTLFDIHNNSSNSQLGEIIFQNGNPVAFYTNTLIEPWKSCKKK